jgi:hypothetical protein
MAQKYRLHTVSAAAVMMAGSAAFLTAACMPIARVFGARDPQRKLAILQSDPVQWRVEQQLFAVGTAVLPVGVVMLARNWDEGLKPDGRERATGPRLARCAAVAIAAGAVPFLVHLEARHRDPQAFALGQLSSGLFIGYTWLNLAGMAALGGGLLVRVHSQESSGALARDPGWPGWLNLGGAAVFGGGFALAGDLPPLLVYAVELATGAALMRHIRRGSHPKTPA